MQRSSTVRSRSAAFQHAETLKRNRAKRTRHREFVVEGVKSITRALDHGWDFHQVWYDLDRPPTGWAEATLARTGRAEHVGTTAELMAELSDRDEPSELIAVVGMRDDPRQFDGLTVNERLLVLALDRPASPGNVGSMIRSADALGVSGVVITGHAADPHDPQAIRASMGSFFALPVIRLPSPADLFQGCERYRAMLPELRVIGAGASEGVPLGTCDLARPLVIVMGNEAGGLSAAHRQRCDILAHIPMHGRAADSLNVAAAAAILLYEVDRQRRHDPL